jgi:hypothetical protein
MQSDDERLSRVSIHAPGRGRLRMEFHFEIRRSEIDWFTSGTGALGSYTINRRLTLV